MARSPPHRSGGRNCSDPFPDDYRLQHTAKSPSAAPHRSRTHESARPHIARTCRGEILALRSLELADRVAAGELGFIDAVDMAYSAAEGAGLPEAVGDDVVRAHAGRRLCQCE